MEPKLKQVFDHLTRWRNLPDYQLERRAEILFSVFMPEILKCGTGLAVRSLIVPEFPVNKRLFTPDYTKNDSSKIDYIAFGEDGKTLFYIELKTDSGSRRESQDNVMDACAKIGFAELFEGLKDIFIATKSKRKYFHLLCLLEDAGVIRLSHSIREDLAAKIIAGRSGVRVLLDKVELISEYPESKIIYVQPESEENYNGNKTFLSFDVIAEIVSKQDGEFGTLFADCLRRWKTPAGELDTVRLLNNNI